MGRYVKAAVRNGNLWPKGRPYTRLEAWLDMTLDKSLNLSERELSHRWLWSKSKVHRFLQYLESGPLFGPPNEPVKAIQQKELNLGAEPASGPLCGPPPLNVSPQTPLLNSSPNDPGVRTPPIVPPKGDNGFLEFWKIYPRKIAKQAALKSWKAIKPSRALQEFIEDKLRLTIATEWKGRHKGHIPHASTWLNQRRWEDDLDLTPDDNNRQIFKEQGWDV